MSEDNKYLDSALSYLQGLGQEATFEFGDELGAGTQTVLETLGHVAGSRDLPPTPYSQAKAQIQQDQDRLGDKHGLARIAGRATGMLAAAPGVSAVKAIRHLPAVAKLGLRVGEGAVGGIANAMGADRDTETGGYLGGIGAVVGGLSGMAALGAAPLLAPKVRIALAAAKLAAKASKGRNKSRLAEAAMQQLVSKSAGKGRNVASLGGHIVDAVEGSEALMSGGEQMSEAPDADIDLDAYMKADDAPEDTPKPGEDDVDVDAFMRE